MMILSLLNSTQFTEFKKLIPKIKNVSAYSLKDLKACNVGAHNIRTVDHPPIFIPPYRKSFKEREIIRREIEEMLKYDIVEPSNSPWSSPNVSCAEERRN